MQQETVGVPSELDIPEVQGWQLDIIEMIKQEPDSRSIIWVVYSEGARGKCLDLAKYLCIKHQAIFLGGAPSVMKYQIISHAKKMKGVAPELIIMDISREQRKVCYAGIATIKHGCFATKRGTMFIMNSPHIVVFANRMPTPGIDFSADRLKIFAAD